VDLQISDLGVTGFPQSILHEDVGILGYLSPFGFAFDLIVQLDVQIAGNDLVIAALNGIGEPCEGSAHQHRAAEQQAQQAQHQCATGSLAIRHCFFLLK
jgi:hypothetical protein